MKKIPMRKCVVTQLQYPKKELIRVVKDKEGNVSVDPTGKMNGRGAYLKKDIEVFETAKKKGILQKVLEIDIPDRIFEDLKKYAE